MFINPIKYKALKSMDELKKFSMSCGSVPESKMKYCSNNGGIVFVNQNGFAQVTPWRPEIFTILEENGYEKGTLFVPYSNGEERPKEYKWLCRIAQLENYNYKRVEAKKISEEKHIEEVSIDTSKFKYRLISFFNDEANNTVYHDMAFNFMKESVGTYIFINFQKIMLCDEFGQTFLVESSEAYISDLINALIDAGYEYNPYPECFIQEYPPST